jgi:hypothetical protein
MTPFLLPRRGFLAGAAAAGLLPWSAQAQYGLPPLTTPRDMHLLYDLSWIGVPVGEHEIVVTPESRGGNFTVTNRVEIAIELLFIDVIRFEHTSTENWRGGLLAQFESRTEDDGEFYEVEGHAAPGGFQVTGKHGTVLAPPDVLTSNDVWIPPVPGSRPFLNAKNGDVVPVTVSQPRNASVRRDGRQTSALRFDISSAVADGAMFYDGELFVSGWFTRRGRTVDYRLK